MEANSKSLQPFVGAIVRTLRHSHEWSQEDLAFAAKVNASEISILETAKRDTRLSTLEKVSRGLGINCSQLLWLAEMLRRRVEREEQADFS